MLDIIELEKQWMRYKLKLYLPYFIVLVTIIIISAIMFIQYNASTTATKPMKKVLAPLVIKETSPTPKKQLPSNKIEVKIEPSLRFLEDMQANSQQYIETPKVSKVTNHKVLKVQKQVKPKTVNIEIPMHEKASKISIKRKETAQDLQAIIARFKASNNPNLSLFIAKKYYAQKDYKQAYNYALITNKINSEIDESWIVFCKALVKLNKKELAIKVLQDYTQSSQSSTANILLSDIKSGKFR